MAEEKAFNVHVFRDGRRALEGRALLSGLAGALAGLGGAGPARGALDEGGRQRALDALLRAGELECILADVGQDRGGAASRLTDALAEALLGAAVDAGALGAGLARIERELPATVRASRPEGFAYYALHPLDFADLARAMLVGSGSGSGRVAVVGIRSIGTTLSAVVAAALRQRGVPAERITVRPGGHPYDRRLELAGPELAWVRAQAGAGADFFGVDEGPGLSGSSFLAVGDALAAAGVPRARVAFLCSRAPDPDALVAPDAARRAREAIWRGVAPASRIPAEAGEFVGGGVWRERWMPDRSTWPACWPTFERIKHVSRDGRRVFKFEGLGPYGAEVRDRAARVAEAGFGPAPAEEGDGFLSYPLIEGRPLRAGDLSAAMLERLADYCAFRAAAMPASDPEPLEEMVRVNAAAVLGVELEKIPALDVVRPVIADGRMMPHEWLDAEGAALKVDAASHGDDHFFPGPTDVAWDLAGAIVEWQMSAAARRVFVDRYARASGDHGVEGRLGPYLVAYALFRAGMCRLAAQAMRGSEEADRLSAEERHYHAVLDVVWPSRATTSWTPGVRAAPETVGRSG